MTTPISDFAEAYARRDPLRLHMPGHKGRGPLERLDITEVDGADVLYHSRGIIRESEENAAALFGSRRTLYSAEGSSLCIRAMLTLALFHAREQGLPPLILAGRNAHSSFLTAAALLDFQIRWLYGSQPLVCLPAPGELSEALSVLSTPPAAVYLTSPDYLGNRADIAALAEVCHERDIPLLVDNAHGAYLRFLSSECGGGHPIDLGADLVCDSAHKTLPVLTGGAYLHIGAKAPDIFFREAERALRLFASTSPSYLILESLDRCNSWLSGEGPSALARTAAMTGELKTRLRAAGYNVVGETYYDDQAYPPPGSVPTKRDTDNRRAMAERNTDNRRAPRGAHTGFSEPLKITLAPKSRGYTGNRLHELLREQGIECEFSDPDYLVMMLSPAIEESGFRLLEDALLSLEPLPPLPESIPLPPRAETVFSPREALLSPCEAVPLSRCPGRILADPCVSCPPAVPILICGERITESAVSCFRYYGQRETLLCLRED